MVRATMILITLIIFLPGPGYATISRMNLIGKGEVYYMGFIKVYDVALYANSKNGGQVVMDAETSRCLKLTYDVSLAVKDFVLGAETILARQHSPEGIAKLRKEIDMLHGAYRDVKKGDSYYLCYDAPQRLTTLTLNDTELIAVRSQDFAEAYFGIWLGAVQPIDEKLRDRLLR
ncbi:MAG: chalcone isomerase family protein [Proteobacteria bacterium]|nr:chalcone isomerase family protein [Pseudomonadota bacterium]